MLHAHVLMQGKRYTAIAFSGMEALNTLFSFKVWIPYHPAESLQQMIGLSVEIHLQDAEKLRIISGLMTECILQETQWICVCEPRLTSLKHTQQAMGLVNQPVLPLLNRILDKLGYQFQTKMQNSQLMTEIIGQLHQDTLNDLQFFLSLLNDAKKILFWDGTAREETLALLNENQPEIIHSFHIHEKTNEGMTALKSFYYSDWSMQEKQINHKKIKIITLTSNHWLCFPGASIFLDENSWIQSIHHEWHYQKGYRNRMVLINRLDGLFNREKQQTAQFYKANRLKGDRCQIPLLSALQFQDCGMITSGASAARGMDECVLMLSTPQLGQPLYACGGLVIEKTLPIVTQNNSNETKLQSAEQHGFTLLEKTDHSVLNFHLSGSAVFLRLQQANQEIALVSNQGDSKFTVNKLECFSENTTVQAMEYHLYTKHMINVVRKSSQYVISHSLHIEAELTLDWQCARTLTFVGKQMVCHADFFCEWQGREQQSYIVKNNIDIQTTQDASIISDASILKTGGVEIQFSKLGTMFIRASQCQLTANSFVGFSGKLIL